MAASWKERMGESGFLPNLGMGGTIAAACITSFFGAHLGDDLYVMVASGPHAFFVEGLRVADWKHGIMSNGQAIPSPYDGLRVVMGFALWMALLFLVEWITGWMAILRQKTSWLAFAIIRFLGGGLLMAFAFRLWGPKFDLLHPVPLSAFISGLVQIWRGTASLIRRKSTPDRGNQ